MATEEKENKVEAPIFYQEGTTREIGVFYEIMRVSNIDTANSTFEAQFELQFTWLPSEEDMKNYKIDPENYKPSFIPKYNWTNAAETNIEIDDAGFQIFANGGTDTWGSEVTLNVPFVNAVLFNGSGTFLVPFMDLRNFPFDVVDLSIELECQQTTDKVVFVPSFDVGNEVVDCLDNVQLLNPAFAFHKPLCEVLVRESDGEKYATFMVHLKWERRWSTYASIYTTLCLLCICTLSVFCFDAIENLNDRLANIFTMLLTVVAYEFVLKSDLPKIPYMTLADIYIVLCFFFVLFIALDCVVIASVDHSDEEKLEEADLFGLAIIIFLFVLWHIVYAVMVCKAKKKEMKKLSWYYAHYNQEVGEEDTAVSHWECHLDKDVRNRLGEYWDKYVEKDDVPKKIGLMQKIIKRLSMISKVRPRSNEVAT